MTAFFNGKPIGQVNKILFNGREYDEDEIRGALKAIPPKPKKRRVSKK